MKSNSFHRKVSPRGMTLIELTIVILVLLSLVSILFIGARGWKNGTDRATCILNLRNVQVATRSYQNLYGYYAGGYPYASAGTQNIAAHLLEKGYIKQEAYESSQGIRKCPGGGTYSTPLPDLFPQPGSLYMVCSLSGSSNHVPQSHADW
ncbi:MAG: prepilin-type N-terminal cleavage/methylation domain-containing protein [Armatimonadetes bacterium]|nr:prepilin-type N-terminal cleavage/methylation domain-containing protein [Akkermansiaceae bacterium]